MVQPLAQTPRRLRLGDQVAGLLLAAIRLHEYLPGQRLPSERELCLRLGVSRAAVREGLHWLEHDGYIEVRRGKLGGAFVCPPVREVAAERLRGKAEQLRQVFEYRSAIEPFGAALAAEHIGGDELALLRRLLAAEESEPDRFRRRALDVEFHQVIADASRNEFVSAAVRQIRIRLAAGLDLQPGSRTRLSESLRGHARIVNALARSNASAARRAMHEHVVTTERAIRGALVQVSLDSASNARPSSGEDLTSAQHLDDSILSVLESTGRDSTP
jgi:GntR family transcriptional regulator, transcriptional repressor for pyruvate dehydrogenase complex